MTTVRDVFMSRSTARDYRSVEALQELEAALDGLTETEANHLLSALRDQAPDTYDIYVFRKFAESVGHFFDGSLTAAEHTRTLRLLPPGDERPVWNAPEIFRGMSAYREFAGEKIRWVIGNQDGPAYDWVGRLDDWHGLPAYRAEDDARLFWVLNSIPIGKPVGSREELATLDDTVTTETIEGVYRTIFEKHVPEGEYSHWFDTAEIIHQHVPCPEELESWRKAARTLLTERQSRLLGSA